MGLGGPTSKNCNPDWWLRPWAREAHGLDRVTGGEQHWQSGGTGWKR